MGNADPQQNVSCTLSSCGWVNAATTIDALTAGGYNILMDLLEAHCAFAEANTPTDPPTTAPSRLDTLIHSPALNCLRNIVVECSLERRAALGIVQYFLNMLVGITPENKPFPVVCACLLLREHIVNPCELFPPVFACVVGGNSTRSLSHGTLVASQ